MRIGYCTNVHAGLDLGSICANLATHAVGVRQELGWGELPIGLWLPHTVAETLDRQSEFSDLEELLAEQKLVPYTLNGFPFGDFHQAVVKHKVYEPTWWEPSRVSYTLRLAEILSRLLNAGESGTISTLPLGWPAAHVSDDHRTQAAANLLDVAARLRELASETGRQIGLALEPEPGCLLQTSHDVVEFFDHFLRPAGERLGDTTLAHLGVCHDVCHAVVMREAQDEAIHRYVSAGIRVMKVQISSCVQVAFDQLERSQRRVALAELSAFAEDRYLHQTTVSRDERSFAFFEDLPQAIAAANGQPQGEWRTHFHVPIHLQGFGALRTSQAAIIECLKVMQSLDEEVAPDYEVETYAWNVLPDSLRAPTLAKGIADELRWIKASRS